jgi:hypothetical protein
MRIVTTLPGAKQENTHSIAQCTTMDDIKELVQATNGSAIHNTELDDCEPK